MIAAVERLFIVRAWSELVRPFDWRGVVIAPWVQDTAFTGWIVLMGFLVTASCGLVGNYLLLRRLALVGDAISHSILAGLVVAFWLFGQGGTWVMVAGALGAGLVTVGMIEFIHRQSRIKLDAAICLVFTVLFAFGVAMLRQLEGRGGIHLDAECVLYGELAFVPLEPAWFLAGVELGPPSVVRMAGIFFLLLIGLIAFYKELLITSFDPALARSSGMWASWWHYGLMGVLTLVIVGVFEAVGAVLAVAMLIVPPMVAAELSDRLPVRLVLIVVQAALVSVIGYHLSLWWQCSPAGAMVVVGAGLFLIVWWGGMLRRAWGQWLGLARKQTPS
jgi:manganese/zinc/iron transport system permease protein